MRKWLALAGVLVLAPMGAASSAPTPTQGAVGGPTPSGELFRPSAYLAPTVHFWEQIFTEYTSTQLVIHDLYRPSVVWNVVDLKTAYEEIPRREVQELTRFAMLDIQTRLRRLHQHPVATDALDEHLLAITASLDDHGIEEPWTRLRIQRGIADEFKVSLMRAKRWIPDVRRVLAQEHVPMELAALPFIESMYNNKAYSSVGAAGVWQLMPGTARQFGLKVSRKRDDRYAITRATKAAARLLQNNLKRLGSWPLAITAYNHGAGGISRGIKQVGSREIEHLISNYQQGSWGFASKNFYAEFLAALSVTKELFPIKGLYNHKSKHIKK
jgi:membrane-bound lytic murein transglycosylase D